MQSVWTYPWNLYEEGLDATMADLTDRGIDAVNLASHYHSIRALQPRFPDSLFAEYPGGCYFDPDPERFGDTSIDPQPNDVPGGDDPVAETVAAAEDHGLEVHGWLVCFHNTRLAAANPEYRIQSAFGDAHDHAFCPSHPEVREYFAAVADALDARGVTEIQLESLCYQSAFHDHGVEHGHDKGQLDLSSAEETLLSQCFCEACRAEAHDQGVDIEAARETVHDLLEATFHNPEPDPPELGALAEEHSELHDLFALRGNVITDLAERMADRVNDARLNAYVGGFGGWSDGLQVTDLDGTLDRMMAMCYVDDPGEARDRIRTLERTVSTPVDAGITIDPDVLDSREEFVALANAIQDEGVEQLAVYNHGFMTEAHLDWLREAFA